MDHKTTCGIHTHQDEHHSQYQTHHPSTSSGSIILIIHYMTTLCYLNSTTEYTCWIDKLLLFISLPPTISRSWKIHTVHHGKHQTPILHLTFTCHNYMMQSREMSRQGYNSGSFLNPEASRHQLGLLTTPPCPTPLSNHTPRIFSCSERGPGSLSRPPPCWTATLPAFFRAVSVMSFFCFFRCHLCSYPWYTTSVLMSKDYHQIHNMSILALDICS